MAAPYTQMSGPKGQARTDMVLRNADVAYIPSDTRNVDWLAYQAWCAAGGTPDPPPQSSLVTVSASIAVGAG